MLTLGLAGSNRQILDCSAFGVFPVDSFKCLLVVRLEARIPKLVIDANLSERNIGQLGGGSRLARNGFLHGGRLLSATANQSKQTKTRYQPELPALRKKRKAFAGFH